MCSINGTSRTFNVGAITVGGQDVAPLQATLNRRFARSFTLLDPAFNLFALQPTTNPVGPLVIVHGPVVEQLGTYPSVDAALESFVREPERPAYRRALAALAESRFIHAS